MHPLEKFCLEARGDSSSPDAGPPRIGFLGEIVILPGFVIGKSTIGQGTESLAGSFVGLAFDCGVEKVGGEGGQDSNCRNDHLPMFPLYLKMHFIPERHI
jgi:hypothetical protein